MPDVFDKEQRSKVMSKVHGENTSPELTVRSLLFSMGYRYRLHRKDLPGKPDIVLPRHKKIIFVHGCFWHQHERCKAAERPTSNTDYWNKKLDRNVERDNNNREKLGEMGWQVLIVWECQIKNRQELTQILTSFLSKELQEQGDGEQGAAPDRFQRA
jgi:DNA mismatch endonuclease (patch repair protein)